MRWIVDGVELIRTIIRQEQARNALVLVASHNAEDIHLLCQEVYRLNHGRLERADWQGVKP